MRKDNIESESTIWRKKLQLHFSFHECKNESISNSRMNEWKLQIELEINFTFNRAQTLRNA